MHIVSIIINIIAIIVLLIGLFHDFETPKNKAVFGYFVVGSMILYVIMMSFATIYAFFTRADFYYLILLLCAISPFIIGKLAKYNTLKRYTTFQILFFIVSLLIILLSA